MLVSTTISDLVDPEGRRLKFSIEDIDSANGRWYQNLTHVEDQIGSIEVLEPTGKDFQGYPPINSEFKSNRSKSIKLIGQQGPSKFSAIEEVNDQSDPEEHDLIAYAKPDSDFSDEDEDATLVQRNRPNAPVFV